jgi:hypothetical protein
MGSPFGCVLRFENVNLSLEAKPKGPSICARLALSILLAYPQVAMRIRLGYNARTGRARFPICHQG